MKLFRVALIILLLASAASGAPSSFTYQGRILKSDGTPLEYNNVSFQFQVTNPTGSCVIYQEEVDGYDMTNSGGVFDTAIGNGTRMYPSSGSLLVSDAFNNGSTFTCKNGGNYSPAVDDGRLLRVQFFDGVGWKTISPDNTIRSIPFASFADSANKIGTHGLNEMIFKPDVNGSVSCNAGNFLTWDATAQTFGCATVSGATGGTVTSVTSANSYITVAAGTTAAVLTANVGTAANTLAAGNDTRIVNAIQSGGTAGGDLSGTYPNPTLAKINNVALAMTTLSSGQYLKYNGTNWINSAIAVADVTGLSTSLSGMVLQSQFPASCAASQTLTFISPSGSFSCSSIAIAGSQVTGDITGNAAGFTGSLAGDVTGPQATTVVAKIKGYGVDFTAAPNSGEYLKYNGSNWVSSAISSSELPTGTLSGAGTAGYIPYYNTTTTLADSSMFFSSGSIGVGTTSPVSKLTVYNSYLTLDRPAGSYQATQYTTAGSSRWITGVSNDAESGSNVGSNYFLNRYNDSGTILGTSMLIARSTGNVLFNTSGGGNVGIGTTNPNGELNVHRNGTTAYTNNGTGSTLPFVSTVDPILTISNFNGTDSDGAYLNFTTTASDSTLNSAYIGGIAKSSQYGADLIFGRRSASSGWAESMTILGTNGYVGIGTSAPSVALEVNGTIKATSFSGPVTATTSSSGAGSNTNPSVTFSGDPDTGFYDAASNNTISVTTGGTNIFNFSSTGLASPTTGGPDITTAAGTEGAPTYSFVGDTGTGWWRPAVSTMAASTGGHERMRIDASGNVGIGTTNPTKPLVAYGSGSNQLMVSKSSTGENSIIYNNTSGTWAVGQSISGTNSFDFYNSGTLMTILPSGNVGIGTPNPASLLSVYKTDAATNSLSSLGVFTHMSTGTAAADLGGVIQFAEQNSSGLPVVSADAGSVITNVTSGSETGDFLIRTLSGGTLNQVLRVTSSGTVGIGTTIPTAKLDVTGGNIAINQNSTWAQYYANSYSNTPGHSGVVYFKKARGTEASPTYVQSGDDLGLITFRNHTASSGASIYASASETHSSTASGTDLHINTTPSGSNAELERVTILNSGNVGIGTTNPAGLFHVNSAGTNPFFITQNDSNVGTLAGTWIRMRYAHGTYSLPTNLAKDDYLGGLSIGTTDGTSMTPSAQVIVGAVATEAHSSIARGSALYFSTTSNGSTAYNEKMRIDNNGNVGIGTASPTGRLHVYTTNSHDGIFLAGSATAGTTSSIQVSANVTAGDHNPITQTGDMGIVYSGTTIGTAKGFFIAPWSSTSAGLRLDGSGNVGIGTSAPTALLSNSSVNTLDVGSNGVNSLNGLAWVVPSTAAIGYVATVSNLRTGSNSHGLLVSLAESGGASRALEVESGGASRFIVSSSGSVGIGSASPAYTLDVNGSVRGTSAYVNSSDVRYKKNIEVIPDSLNKVLQVRGVTFDWRTDEFPDKKFSKDHDMGVIAQEVEAVFPEAVRTDDQGYKSVAYTELVAPLINAVKELYAKWSSDSQGIHRDIASVNAKVDGKVSQLETENAALKAENAAMKTRLDKIEKMLNSK